MTKVLLKEIRRQHQHEHAALDLALRRAVAVADDIDPRSLQLAWTVFEHRLLRHLEFEESSLFSIVEGAHAQAISELKQEHQRIRHLVSEVGLGCDLHTVHGDAVQRLAKLLAEHAAREDKVLDAWIEQAAPTDTRRHLGRLFVSMVREELRPGDSPPPVMRAG